MFTMKYRDIKNNILVKYRMNENTKDIYWYEDVSVLYKNDKYLDFIPNSKMNYNEKINAMVRFCVYAIILSLIFNKSQRILILPILLILMTKIISKKNRKIEKYENEILKNGDMRDLFDTMIQTDNEKKVQIPEKSFESGILNSDGQYEGGEIYRDPSYPILDKKNNESILENRKPIITRQPTIDNPYMNPFVTDFNNDDIIPAPSNANDEDIQNKISKKFNNGLFMNIEDMWDIKNSQRQFFTIPVSSIAGGQKEFSEWLYKDKECCKTDQMGCLRYEDLRYKRF